MTLLDRFRTQSREKNPDPAVRLAFVDELALDDRATIAAVAREDEDPRVRKAAVAKLMVPSELAAIARDDRDDGVRAQAAAMLRDLALEAFEDAGEAESLEAVEAIADPRVLGQIAKSSAREAVAIRALSRIEDAHQLGSVARHGVVESVRGQALATLRQRSELHELLAVAMNSDFKDTALSAMEGVTSRDELDQVIARGRNKSAVKRARAVVREMEEQAAREAAEAAAERAMTVANESVIEPVVETAPPDSDASTPAIVPAEETALSADEVRRREAEAEADAAERARLADETAEAAARDVEQRHARLADLAEHAVASASETDLSAARKRFGAVAREWHDISTGLTVDPALLARFTEIEAVFTERDREARESDQRTRREAHAKLVALLGRTEPLIEKGDLTLKAAERALRDVRTALSAMPPLPSKQDFEDVSKRLKAAQTTLGPKVTELREADDWRRFANVSIQEQLCAKMEALRPVTDAEKVAHEVRDLQQQWRQAADVPRAQADALWRRFKTAHDEVWAECEARFAADAQERSANLARKTALCESAEAQSESTSWIQTAEAIKKLQAEWKTIGPVSRGKEKAIWDRFRAACDRFFTRRHEDLAQRKASWNDNLAKKDALCAQAEALAESSDWDQATVEIKKLQAEWRTIGPVKKSKSDAIWQRFRAACDHFFARHAARHDTARAERVAARETICAELESFAAGDEAPADLQAKIRGVRARWQQEIASRGVDPDRARALDQRFAAALAAVLAKWPAAFAGSDLDPDANRKRMEALVQRIEALASSLAGPAAADDNLTPTERLAAMLKERLAANTIGGKVSDEGRFRAAAEEARQAQASWSRLGQVPDDVRAPLAGRFQRALRSISDRTAPPRGR